MIKVVEPEHVVITPRPPSAGDPEGMIFPEAVVCSTEHGDIDVVWASNGVIFRMDVETPSAIALDIILPLRATRVFVNGEVVWSNNAFQHNGSGVYAGEASTSETRLRCAARSAFHILASREAA